jgi:hypothetical protein
MLWRRNRPFRWNELRATLAQGRAPAHRAAAPNAACCRAISTSFPARGRTSVGQSSTTSRIEPLPAIGPSVFRSLRLRSTCSSHGSAISSTNSSYRRII